MNIKRGPTAAFTRSIAVALFLCAAGSASGEQTASLRHWNQIAIDASGLDHTPVAPGENRVFGEQYGPTRASRAMAIVHIAMFDAANAIDGGYEGYTGLPPALDDTSADAAIALAAHDTLVALFPSQSAIMDGYLDEDLGEIPDGGAKLRGIGLGRRAAGAILKARQGDGSDRPEPRIGIEFLPGNEPGRWRQDPISLNPLALGAYWGQVHPFVLRSADRFRVPPPPALRSREYAEAFHEVKRLGGDGVITPTLRTPDQTFAGIFWSYDGTPSLCAPPRLYNQVAGVVARQRGTSGIELARLLALVNTTMADAAIAVWESKYHYQVWRPVTGIREADPETGPTGLGDGNRRTVGDPGFAPLGGQASNLRGPNFTPPFPSYPSGHAGIGGSLFEALRRFYETDRIAFTLISDEFNGVTENNQGQVRPFRPRSFSTLSEAEEENGQSRINLGVHWPFDKVKGIELGHRVADDVFANAFRPNRRR